MVITKNKTAGLTISFDNNSDVAISFDGISKIKASISDTLIPTPGEFEYSGVHFTALEDTEEIYTGDINVLHISGGKENNSILITTKSGLTKESFDKLPESDVVILLGQNVAASEKLLKRLSPYAQIFLFEDKDESIKDELKKEYSIADDSISDKIKISIEKVLDDADIISSSYILG